MAASQRQLDSIARKLEDYQKDRQALQDALDVYVGNVTIVVNTWLESRGRHGRNSQEMIAFLGKSSGFIVEKAGEIEAKICEEDADGTPSSSSVTSSSPSSSPAASPHLVGASTQVSEQLKKLKTRLDGLSKQFSSSLQEYTQSRDKDRGQMKKLEDRMNQVENSVLDLSGDLSGMQKKMKKYDEKIGDLDKKVGSIEERQNVAEKEKKNEAGIIRNSQKKIEERECDQRMLEDVTERVKRTEEEMKIKYSDLDKKVGSIEQRQSVLEKEKEKEADLIKNIQKKFEQKESDQKMLKDLTWSPPQRPLYGYEDLQLLQQRMPLQTGNYNDMSAFPVPASSALPAGRDQQPLRPNVPLRPNAPFIGPSADTSKMPRVDAQSQLINTASDRPLHSSTAFALPTYVPEPAGLKCPLLPIQFPQFPIPPVTNAAVHAGTLATTQFQETYQSHVNTPKWLDELNQLTQDFYKTGYGSSPSGGKASGTRMSTRTGSSEITPDANMYPTQEFGKQGFQRDIPAPATANQAGPIGGPYNSKSGTISACDGSSSSSLTDNAPSTGVKQLQLSRQSNRSKKISIASILEQSK